MVLTVVILSISDIKNAPNVEFSLFKGESVVKSCKSRVLVFEGTRFEASRLRVTCNQTKVTT